MAAAKSSNKKKPPTKLATKGKGPAKAQGKGLAKVQAKPKTKAKAKVAAKSMKAGPKKSAPTKPSAKTMKAAAPSKAQATQAKSPMKMAAKKVAPKTSLLTKAADALKSLVTKATPTKASEAKSSPNRATRILADLAKIFSPLDDRVVIERAQALERTTGGLYIPDSVTAGEKPNKGKVLAVGPGHRDKKGRLRPLDVKLGDTVMFAQHAGSEINLDGQDLLVLRENEIVAVMS